MTRKNKTRNGVLAQKKGVCVAVIPFVEADILVDGSVYVEMPKRSIITNVFGNIKVTSGTASAVLTVVANGSTIVNSLSVTAETVVAGSLIPSSQYLETGGELVIKSGAVAPATGSLVGELVVEYVELIRNIGEYTTFLDS